MPSAPVRVASSRNWRTSSGRLASRSNADSISGACVAAWTTAAVLCAQNLTRLSRRWLRTSDSTASAAAGSLTSIATCCPASSAASASPSVGTRSSLPRRCSRRTPASVVRSSRRAVRVVRHSVGSCISTGWASAVSRTSISTTSAPRSWATRMPARLFSGASRGQVRWAMTSAVTQCQRRRPATGVPSRCGQAQRVRRSGRADRRWTRRRDHQSREGAVPQAGSDQARPRPATTSPSGRR